MTKVIECRSTLQITEDNIVELHTRLTKWLCELRNERCYNWRDREWKGQQIERMEKLVHKTEQVIMGEVPTSCFDAYSIECLGIKYSSMIRY